MLPPERDYGHQAMPCPKIIQYVLALLHFRLNVFFKKQLCISKSTNCFFPLTQKTLADNCSHTIWRMWIVYFSKLLNALIRHTHRSVKNFRKTNYSWEHLSEILLMTSPCKLRFYELSGHKRVFLAASQALGVWMFMGKIYRNNTCL